MSLILCGCGCGEQLVPDKRGRLRSKYKNGHYIRIYNPRKGKPYTKEESKVLSLSLIGKLPWNTGKYLSEEHKEKIRKNSPHLSQEYHPNWKGGITVLNQTIRNSGQYSNWRTQVFGRDNFTCQKCGIRGTWL